MTILKFTIFIAVTKTPRLIPQSNRILVRRKFRLQRQHLLRGQLRPKPRKQRSSTSYGKPETVKPVRPAIRKARLLHTQETR